MDKRALPAGGPLNVVHLETGTTHTGTVQPATAPNGRYETAQQGTEYFMNFRRSTTNRRSCSCSNPFTGLKGLSDFVSLPLIQSVFAMTW